MKNGSENNKGTFLISIEDRQNATWQGSVTWVDQKKRQYFRSALEMLKLIESALEEQEGGHYEA